MKILKKKKTLIILLIIIAIIILASIATILISKPNILKRNPLQQLEETKIDIQCEVKQRLWNGYAYVLIRVTSNTQIENIIFPNTDGTTTTINTTRLSVAKDLEVEIGKEYEVTVNTKDGTSKTENIIVERAIADIVQVGDFVNYSAGNWTEEDINKLGSYYEGENLPTKRSKVGGFVVGSSKDDSIQASTATNESNIYSGGWRVLSKNHDGSVNIIHAGTPESVCLKYSLQNSSGGPSFDIIQHRNEIANRNYTMYEDCSTDAIGTNFAIEGSAHVIKKGEVNTLSINSDLRKIGIKYFYDYDIESHNDTWPITRFLKGIYRDGRIEYFHEPVGVRIVLTLKPNINPTSANGQTTHITRETAWQLSLNE